MSDKKYILITSGKGGTGKTTLADEILYSFERTGDSADFINLDPQQGAAHEEITRAEENNVVIVDTPGIITDDLTHQLSEASLIIIPVRPSIKDQPMLEMVRALARNNAPNTPVIIVQMTTPFKASRDFSAWLQNSLTSNERLAFVPQTEQAVRAAMESKSAMQFDKTGKLSVAYWRLTNEIREILGLEAEPMPTRRDGTPYKAFC